MNEGPQAARTVSPRHKIMPVHAVEETCMLAEKRWLHSCSRQSRQSFGLQKLDDSAHSFLAKSLLCASHPSDKQDNMPAYLTELTPLSTTSCFASLNTLCLHLYAPPHSHPHITAAWNLMLQILSQSFHRHAVSNYYCSWLLRQTSKSPSITSETISLHLTLFSGKKQLDTNKKHKRSHGNSVLFLLFWAIIQFQIPILGAVCLPALAHEPTLIYTTWEWMWFSAAYGELLSWLHYS